MTDAKELLWEELIHQIVRHRASRRLELQAARGEALRSGIPAQDVPVIVDEHRREKRERTKHSAQPSRVP